MSKLTDVITKLARPAAESAGCALWDVEYIKEGGRWYLRIYIDRDGGISTEHCEKVSRALEPLLDEKDPIPEAYILEVSSAGLERTLKRPEHFDKCLGRNVEAALYAPRGGSKTLKGVLDAYGGDTVTISGECLEIKDISKINLTYSWEELTT